MDDIHTVDRFRAWNVNTVGIAWKDVDEETALGEKVGEGEFNPRVVSGEERLEPRVGWDGRGGVGSIVVCPRSGGPRGGG